MEMPASSEDHITAIRRQFGTSAQEYVRSSVHAAGDDLETLASWAEGGPDKRLLDIATGGGHTALRMAGLYGEVVASDITEEMLGAAREFIEAQGARNVTFALADAEDLPFPAAAFDAVSCRIAPHHFRRPERFVSEVVRVLKPGGIFLLEDSIAPEHWGLAMTLNEVERLRDPTHVRSLTETEWLALMNQAGFEVEERAIDRKRHDLDNWMGRSRTPPEGRSQIQKLVSPDEPERVEAFGLEFDADGRCVAFTDEKLLVKGRKL